MAHEPPDRRFNDREVALILKTAVELQAQEPAPAATRGLSLTELEQLAVEAGIDPAMIRRAARDVEARAAHGGGSSWMGAASEFVVEREVDGEAGVAAHEAVLLELRQATGAIGEASTVGRVFGWRGKRKKTRVEAHVSSERGRTLVRLRIALTEPALDVFGGYTTAGGVGGFTLLAFTLGPLGAPALAIFAGFTAAGFAMARRRFRQVAAENHAWATALVDRLAERIDAAPAPRDALPTAAAVPALPKAT